MIFKSNYQINMLDETSYNSMGVIESDTSSYDPQRFNYTGIPGQNCMITFDKDSQSVYISDFPIEIYSSSNELLARIDSNDFPGVSYPPLILNESSFYITHQLANFIMYVIPIAPMVEDLPGNLFEGNYALSGAGGGVHFYYGTLNSVVLNAKFTGNSALGNSQGYGGGIAAWLTTTTVTILQTSFESNRAELSGGGLALLSGNFGITLVNLSFVNNLASGNGGSIFVGFVNGEGPLLWQNQIVINSSVIRSSVATLGDGVYLGSSNLVVLTNCSVQSNNADSGAGIYLDAGNEMTLIGTTISENSAESCGGAIVLSFSNVIKVDDVVASFNSAKEMGGALCLMDSSTVIVSRDFILTHNRANFGGGGMALVRTSFYSSANDSFGQVIMQSNTAARGSALLVYQLLENSSIANTIFVDNLATVGGTVFWFYDDTMTSEPQGLNSESVIFANNSFGYREVTTQPLTLLAPDIYDVTVYDASLSPTISLTMHDFYGAFVNASKVTNIAVEVLNSSTLSNCSGLPASLGGSNLFSTGVMVEKGVAEFASLEAFCFPGGSLEVQFQTQPADSTDIPDMALRLFYITNTTIFSFRNCMEGEYLANGQCKQCTNGSYSLIAGVAQCDSCVGKVGVNACYSNQIVVSSGYWRRYSSHEAVLKCLIADGCEGGSATGQALCAEGYEGPLCAVCSSDYYNDGSVCQACDTSNEMSPLLIALIIIFALTVAAIVTYYSYLYAYVDIALLKRQIASSVAKGTPRPKLTSMQLFYLWAKKKAEETTVKLKVFVSTYQVVTECTSVFNVSMPSSFSAFANAFSFLNLNVYSLFPFSCATSLNFMDELLWTTLSPIFIATAIAVIVAVAYARLQSQGFEAEAHIQYETIKDRAIVALFFLSYLVLPSVSITIFQTFICQNVDPNNEDSDMDDYFLTADMSISCTSSYYYSWVVYACAMIVVYPIGIPFAYFALLYRSREKIMNRNESQPSDKVLAEEVLDADITIEAKMRKALSSRPSEPALLVSTQVSELAESDDSSPMLSAGVSRLSFLWAAYEPQYWYWEVIEAFRRIVLTAVLSAIAPGTSSQNVLSIIVAVLFIKLYASYRPYDDDVDDMLAELGQIQIFFTYLTLLVQQNDLLPNMYETSMGVLLILINLSLPIFTFYYEMQAYYEEQGEAIHSAAEEIVQEAKASLDASRKAFMQGMSSLAPAGNKPFPGKAARRRKSTVQSAAEKDFVWAMQYTAQQRTDRNRGPEQGLAHTTKKRKDGRQRSPAGYDSGHDIELTSIYKPDASSGAFAASYDRRQLKK